MKRAAVISVIFVAVAGPAALFAESCGAMGFELPPEEPAPEASSPPRLVRRDGGAPELDPKTTPP